MQEYPIGVTGTPWQVAEKQQWFDAQTTKRSYVEEVLQKLDKPINNFVKIQYGELDYSNRDTKSSGTYRLFAFQSTPFNSNLPTVLVTGGVHGYETSGVQGAIDFLLNHAASYLAHFNFIIVPCVSPWGYETVNRWNPDAIDPNRSFYLASGCNESFMVMDFVNQTLIKNQTSLLMHIDLHETTDTDNSEFRPALAARDAITDMPEWEIPDGFYTVADTSNPQSAFQKAIIDAVSKVTHIAPSDENNKIIGADTISEGVICYDKKKLNLCGGFTDAEYVSTTEVYPDSPNATPDICIEAQVAAIKGALDYLI